MNLHEYQAKQLFRDSGLPVSSGYFTTSSEAAIQACKDLGGDKWVVKAQVHAGGRGKAGGVKLITDPNQAGEFAKQWIGKNLVTFQTDEKGQPVSGILVETCTDIEKELYLAVVLDRESQRVVLMASTEGGVNIEEIAASTPEKILKQEIDPLMGPKAWQARQIAYGLGLNPLQVKQFTGIFTNLVNVLLDKDLVLVEVNPLVITTQGDLHCLDAKITVDDNALYRHADIAAMRDPSQEDPREAEAALNELNYVSLGGSIGCMVNGAGLAMATMDLIQFYGGSPANFLDVGGRTTADRVAKAFKLVLSDKNVKAVLVNIFGGIVRCDILADGIIQAIDEVGVNVPVVVRLEGNKAELGLKKLANAGSNVVTAYGLDDAAKKVIEVAK